MQNATPVEKAWDMMACPLNLLTRPHAKDIIPCHHLPRTVMDEFADGFVLRSRARRRKSSA